MTTRNITFKAKWIKILSTVPASIRAQYVAAIYEYMLNGTEPKDMHMQVAFAFFKDEIDRAARLRARRNNDTNSGDGTPDANNNPVAEKAIETKHQTSSANLNEEQNRKMVEEKKVRCAGCPCLMRPDYCYDKECPQYQPNDKYVVNCLFTDDDEPPK